MSDLLIRRRNLLIRKQEEEMNIRAVCFKADGEQTVTIVKVNISSAKVFQYSYDGVTWESWDLTPLPFGGPTKVYIRGYNKALSYDIATYEYFSFGTDAYVYVSGIVESLLDGDNEVLTYGTQGILRQLFYHQTALRSAENLRFEAQSTAYGVVSVYALMFQGCTNLLYAPKVLSANNFEGFYNYQYMFDGCTSLITAPELPATKLADQCYQYMFRNCTSLITAPELPATKLATRCYQYMFRNCTSLKTIRCRAKFKSTDSTYSWLDNVSPSGTLYGHSEYGWSSGVSGIPSGWTFVELTDQNTIDYDIHKRH